MSAEPSYFEHAADVLQLAMDATNFGEQERLLEEALRLNRLALAEQEAELGGAGRVIDAS